MNARNPQDVFVFFDDFLGCTYALDQDDVSLTTTTAGQTWVYHAAAGGGATAELVDASYNYLSTLGGVLRVTTIASPDDGGNFQVNGTPFVIDADCGLPLYFEARFRTADVSNTDYCVGLSAVDEEIITSGADDFVGFLLESGVLYTHCAESSKEYSVDSAITEADGAAGSNAGWVRGKFTFDGNDKVSFFIDDDDDGEFDLVNSVTVSTTLHYLPDDVTLTPTIEVITGTTYSAETFDIDYILCAQQRYHA
jgi:hypothetical protein